MAAMRACRRARNGGETISDLNDVVAEDRQRCTVGSQVPIQPTLTQMTAGRLLKAFPRRCGKMALPSRTTESSLSGIPRFLNLRLWPPLRGTCLTFSNNWNALRIQNLLIVAFARNGTVIPRGEFLIEPDFHRLGIFIRVALLERVVTGENMDGCFQALFCARPCHGLAGHLS